MTEYLKAAADQARYSLRFDFDGYHIRFATNSEMLNAELADYYRHFLGSDDGPVNAVVQGLQCESPVIEGEWTVKPPEPGKQRVKEHLLAVDGGKIVKKIQTGVHLFFVGERRVCAGPLEDNPNQVVNFINNVYLDHLLAPAGQLFHAAGVCRGDFGIGMAGLSGKGKSTLALRLLQRGLDLVSNDRLVVRDSAGELAMHGIAKYPRINPGTVINQPELRGMVSPADLARYEAMPADELWELEEKYDAFVEPAFGASFQLGATMNMFVALDWDRSLDVPTRLERRNPAECPELVATIMKLPGVMLPGASARIPAMDVNAYIELLQHCDFYALTGGVDFDAAADQVLEAP